MQIYGSELWLPLLVCYRILVVCCIGSVSTPLEAWYTPETLMKEV